MRFHSLNPLLLLVAALLVVGCNVAGNKVTKVTQGGNKPLGPETTYADGARRITIPELQELIKENNVFIVDVRNQASFDAGHIPGAKLIPSTEILNHLDDLPKNKLIVTYCA
ncbi:MAG TPA: rhodanese-like domain-containing protein [Pyrinomonadaceae bacterium]|jgi:3-mercaptopyruvate sulfurtransferase SseA|nr:rhodanese-like domain-containing protein [Pyrinomonadaceae bacterium]